MHIFHNIYVKVLIIVFGFVINSSNVYAQSDISPSLSLATSVTNDSIAQLINDYSQGFVYHNFDQIRNSIGQQLIMINGNFSGKPVDWQAHQFLNKKEIDSWITMMLNNAKPFENEVNIKNIDRRGNSAIVVTEEKGKNKFRNWENEEVVYMLGKISNNWKIVGIFIKSLKNPD